MGFDFNLFTTGIIPKGMVLLKDILVIFEIFITHYHMTVMEVLIYGIDVYVARETNN